jgi:hypothetical protein
MTSAVAQATIHTVWILGLRAPSHWQEIALKWGKFKNLTAELAKLKATSFSLGVLSYIHSTLDFCRHFNE